MSKSQSDVAQHKHITSPPSATDQPLPPPHTDRKSPAGALRVLALFRRIQAGTHTDQDPWIEFQLAQGEYDQIENTLRQDGVLWGFVDDKIRYDYDESTRRLVVRKPTGVHELFINELEDDIRSQLKAIRGGFDRKAQFAQKYEPDASFGHSGAQYPGVIIEVAYSQKKKRLSRLAENYLLDSDASVRVVVGLDVEYGKQQSRKATLSIWRPQLFETADGLELRAVEEATDEAFRDDQGNPVEHPGLRLFLSDFTCEELSQEEIGNDDTEIRISGIQLCHYLAAAEGKMRRALSKHSLAKGVTKRRRSETSFKEIKPGAEARYDEQEERAAKRTADYDID
ncbi:hypothetical protein BU25DRAFT_443956 [Macroventuria anomochaeta]|uniref:Uncharacterized protein n=1 Tax=Macroventuria anomochaeta TaxID=301207 RepID=A0ACB6RH87_9PLEO|nr:uncharacterized protein BU25DRAFT_443956 [Macroventuria anomochaeta]KAF2621118.1 hypothetical protein BU25DRAFT_443956 [Macroventuria anomochaeta]